MDGFRVAASGIHGLGLYAARAIPRRMKLGELSGELVRLPEGRVAHLARGVVFLVEFTRRVGLDCTRGNAFRHLNHSCAPNCWLRVVGRRVEVYSRGPLPAGSELTVDYGRTQHRGGMACGCGAARCRGRI
jgi:SET domain-containing protein